MPISMFQVSVPRFIHTLESLRSILDKAMAYEEAKKLDPSVLPNARLYPDMLPLSSQVQIATDIARSTTARLAGVEPPSYEDNEKTLDDLTARIQRTVDYMAGLDVSAFENATTREITRPVRGQPHTFTGTNYFLQFAVPNVYFHAATAYGILRHNGVPLGKADFLGVLD